MEMIKAGQQDDAISTVAEGELYKADGSRRQCGLNPNNLTIMLTSMPVTASALSALRK